MNRKERHAARLAQSTIIDTARALDRAMRVAGISPAERESFLNRAIALMWKSFKEERMNKRITIENEIRQLGIRFPNGVANKEYEYIFDLPLDILDQIHDVRMEGIEDLGLEFHMNEEGTCMLSGKPNKSGDFTVTLCYSTEPGEPESTLRIPIAFNPDPRSLWRNIPSDQTIMFAQPDSEVEYVKVRGKIDGKPRKDMVAASQRGRSHAQEGKPRDDNFGLYHCSHSDWYVLAVADGAGSAKYSRRGSALACQTVVEHCKGLLQDNPDFEKAICDYAADRNDVNKRTDVTRQVIDIVFTGAKKAHEVIKRQSESMIGGQLKDFATTLMFAVCKKYDFGWFLATFWVGDGAMCLFDKETKTAKLLGTPDEGEFSGQTRFLTMQDIFLDPEVVSKRLRMAIVDDFTALFLMSDGVSDPMFETDNNLNSYSKWEEFYDHLCKGFPKDDIGGVELTDNNTEAKEQLLKWLDFWSPGNHDDRTLAILY